MAGATKSKALTMASLLLVADAVLVAIIIYRVPYTKIDWDAYMSQIDGFLAGERNYTSLRGDTGPLVYPAGFLYFYSAVQYLTDGAVFPAQVVFGVLYVLNMGIVLLIYYRTHLLPWWALCLLCLSKRVHSIFVLRLFNDCVAMTLAHLAILCFQSAKWKFGMVVFSVAVSVKMNVLLYSPPLLILMLKALQLVDVGICLFLAALVQVLLGMPFLLTYPLEYISKAFDLGRVFIHFWSVNFKFVPEGVFVSKSFAAALMVVHLSLLFLFAQCKWCKHDGGLIPLLRAKLERHQLRTLYSSMLRSLQGKNDQTFLDPKYVTTVLFTGNFIGILCARSLHYQFYCWYFFTVPYLLWTSPMPTFVRLMTFAAIEACWNVYPSNSTSSLILLLCHLCILWGLWKGSCDPIAERSKKVE